MTVISIESAASATTSRLAESSAGQFEPTLTQERSWLDWATAGRVLTASFIPGVPFVIARVLLHKHSGIVNLDYFLLTILGCVFSRRLASGLLLLTFAFESIRLLDEVYFFTQQDASFVVRFLGDAPKWLVLEWLLSFGVVCAVLLRVWLMLLPSVRGGGLRRAATRVALLLGVFLAVDVAQGFIPHSLMQRFKPIQKIVPGEPRQHLVGELLLRMPLEMAATRSPQKTAPFVLSSSATAPLWSDSVVRKRRDNVVIVVVESMGLLLDQPGRKREFKAFDDPELMRHYIVKEGAVPFRGATIAGEMRELCHLQTGVQVTEATLVGKAPCLPQQFRDLGYETVAYHGYRGMMFQRQEWYPIVGFGEETFLGGLGNLPICKGAFDGACDVDVARLIEGRLVAKRASGAPPQLVHWMTLNSHLPVGMKQAPVRECPIQADRVVCAQLAYVGAVIDSVKQLALDPNIGRTAIVIVGDHAPPYISAERRDLFDDSNVPYITLTPRG